MPRSRIVKPEFWDDEVLAQSTSRDARLLFIGMWNHSDDYGVVKGNATWLKSKIFPYEEIKTETFQKWLGELEKGKWIIPFSVDGAKYYYIQAFTKHQTINRPSQQRNPEPPQSILGTLTDDSRSAHGVLMDEVNRSKENINTLVGDGITDPCPHQEILSLYKKNLPMLTQHSEWGDDRRKLLRDRWRSDKEFQDLEWWDEFFQYIARDCPFLTGDNNRGWSADLPWILQKKHFTEIREGKYYRGVK